MCYNMTESNTKTWRQTAVSALLYTLQQCDQPLSSGNMHERNDNQSLSNFLQNSI